MRNRLHAAHIVQYFDDINLGEKLQSAYKKLHNAETALLRVHDDILHAVDGGCTVVLLLLNLSGAFDTVNHGLSLRRRNTGLLSKANSLPGSSAISLTEVNLLA